MCTFGFTGSCLPGLQRNVFYILGCICVNSFLICLRDLLLDPKLGLPKQNATSNSLSCSKSSSVVTISALLLAGSIPTSDFNLTFKWDCVHNLRLIPNQYVCICTPTHNGTKYNYQSHQSILHWIFVKFLLGSLLIIFSRKNFVLLLLHGLDNIHMFLLCTISTTKFNVMYPTGVYHSYTVLF